MDTMRFCSAESAQKFCAENTGNAFCKDGAEEGKNEWLPQQQVQIYSKGVPTGDTVNCQCMKNCGCTKDKCWCSDTKQKRAAALPSWCTDRLYSFYSTGGCAGTNELGCSEVDTASSCQALCDTAPDCISFDYAKTGSPAKCCLSTSCTYDQSVMDPHDAMNFYVKPLSCEERPYSIYDTGGCAGKNELGCSELDTASSCQVQCDIEPDCISFEYAKTGSPAKCCLSTSCTYDQSVMDTHDPMNLYVKRTYPGNEFSK